MSLLEELKRRNVIRVALAYGVLGWLVLQVADVLVNALELPAMWSKAVVALLVVGFIPALVFSWVYELTPEGLKKESEIAREQSITGHTAKKLNHAIIFLLLVAIGLFAYDRFFVTHQRVSGKPASGVAGHGPGEVLPSVAVLAFANMSADADNEYFADGISEEILNLLADVRGLSVASRTSAFAFKGSSLPIPEIAGALKVRYVLEGSVRKAGEQVRVTAQLIDARTDRHLWSKTFDRALRDVFTIQDEIAAAIGGALQVELLGDGGVEVRSESIDPGIYNQFLEARFLMRKRNPDDLDAGNRLLIDVVAAEPKFARAHVLLGEAYLLNEKLRDTVGMPFLARLANMHASLARQLDPSLSGIDMILGNIAQENRQFSTAFEYYARAIELEPMEPRPYHWRGFLFNVTGDGARCKEDMERALELDPQNPNVHFALASCVMISGDFDRAAELAAEGSTLGNPFGYGLAVNAMVQKGDRQAALRHLVHLQDELGDDSERWGILRALWEGRLVEDDLTDEQLDGMGLNGLLFLDDQEPFLRSLAASEPGEVNNALIGVLFGAGYQAIRSDPRFIDLLESEGILDYWRERGPPEGCRAVGDSFSCAPE